MPRKMKDSGVEWIGAIPEGWKIQPLKTVVRQITERAESPSAYVGLENVESWTGRYVENDSVPIDGMAIMVQAQDVLFGKLRPYLAKCIEAKAPGCCSTEFLVLRILSACSTYLKYLMLSPAFIDCVNMSTYGTKMPRANWDYIRQIQIPVPAIPVQCSIANFLDTKCSEIDAAIASARQSIEECKALKKSLVFETVTGKRKVGSVEGESCRKMRDSGIPWIGAVPEEWRYIKSQHVLESVGDVDHYMPETADEGVPYVMTGNLRPRSSLIDFVSCKHISREDYKAISKKTATRRGDVIFARYATIGTVCLVDTDIDFAVSYSCVTIRPKLAQLDSRYLFYYLQSSAYAEEIKKYVNTNIQGNVGISSICQAKMMCPPLSEQRAIVGYLDEKCGAIDALVAEKESLIVDLEAYKKSLIFEVVTGKREVA